MKYFLLLVDFFGFSLWCRERIFIGETKKSSGFFSDEWIHGIFPFLFFFPSAILLMFVSFKNPTIKTKFTPEYDKKKSRKIPKNNEKIKI